MKQLSIYPEVSQTIEEARELTISDERKTVLNVLIEYIRQKVDQKHSVNLNFICTHNSRRSQFSQIWAQTAADYFGVKVSCYSGGVEVTAFNERAVASIKRMGFEVSSEGESNPVYTVAHSKNGQPIKCFSKVFDDLVNEAKAFAAVMTCSHADENCPFIPGTEKRIPVRYHDPKEYDDTAFEVEKYDERSMQIASEMFYVFSQI